VGSGSSSSPLPFLAGGNLQEQPKRNKAVDFSSLLFLRSGSFGFLDLLHCRSVSFGHLLLLLCSICCTARRNRRGSGVAAGGGELGLLACGLLLFAILLAFGELAAGSERKS
jgi:hypothetical protein